MTKVQLCFDLRDPLTDAMMDRISRAHGMWGLTHLVLSPSLDQLTVEYDAARLSPMEVESTIARMGIAVKPHVETPPPTPEPTDNPGPSTAGRSNY